MSQTYSFRQALPSSLKRERWPGGESGDGSDLLPIFPGEAYPHASVMERDGLRLLFVSHSFPPPNSPMENVGGMQRVATELHAALAAHEDVAIHSELLQTQWKWTHVRIIPFVARLLVQIPRIVRREKIDVILFSSMVTAVMAPPLRRSLADVDVKMAAIAHGRDITLPVAPYQAYLRMVFGAVDRVLPVSRATANECHKRGLQRSKIDVIPNGINATRFRELGPKAVMRAELNDTFAERFGTVPENAMLLCAAGRHVERKGFGWFVENVMPLLRPDVHFWLAGEGPMSEEIQATADRFGLDKRVRLVGKVTDRELETLYRGADLFIMPNIPVEGDLEGFGVVMLEAGLCGMPTVASRLEGIRDVIDEGENGFLVPSGDLWSFYEVIQHYYHHRSRLIDDSLRAVRYTRETFTWPSVAEKYIRILSAMAGRGEPVMEGAEVATAA